MTAHRYTIFADDLPPAEHCGTRCCPICDAATERGHWVDACNELTGAREAVDDARRRGSRNVRLTDRTTAQPLPMMPQLAAEVRRRGYDFDAAASRRACVLCGRRTRGRRTSRGCDDATDEPWCPACLTAPYLEPKESR